MRKLRLLWKALWHPREAVRLAFHHLLISNQVRRLERLGGITLLAWLACRALEVSVKRRDQARVLVLNRLYFSKDVDQLRARCRQLGFVSLDTHILSMAQMLWLPETLCEQIAYADRSTEEHDDAWAMCERYAEAILKRVMRRWNVRAVLVSNVDYWQHEAFRRRCNALRIPFLVLCQEEQTVPSVYDLSIDMYRGYGLFFLA